MKKNIIIILLVILIAGYAGWKLSHFAARPSRTEVTSTTVINQIKKVAKLVTVEGNISEVYTHKDKVPFMGWGPYSEKKAMIRVEAKVLAGYDLEKMTYKVDEKSKTITITSLPEPEIMSIDDDLSYYDISEGYWNSFSEEDYNKINRQIKEYVRQVAKEGEVMDVARQQGLDLLMSMQDLVSLSGWKLVLPPQKSPSLPPEKPQEIQ
ncbi:MAG TPA: DUF4230 domain-containing protein [Saprospiraceae bacterium]|nr:DUF4230 domain-containing protein [Saprospiraceae bacterium]